MNYLSQIIIILTLAAALAASPAHAATSGWRTITEMGCHVSDGTCWVILTGALMGPSTCRQGQLRFRRDGELNSGVYDALHAAFLAGKRVNFEVGDSACYALQPLFPTFHWYSVQ